MRTIELEAHPYLVVGLVEAQVSPGPSSEALQALLGLDGAVPPRFHLGAEGRQNVHDAVRELLRHTGYRPSGRGKPASEFLARSAESHGRMRSINNLVDVNNVASLHSGLPMSLFDGDLIGSELRVAPGKPEEGYVFNPSGQEIRLDGLLTVYHRQGPDEAWKPAGNAVKDSMATKISDGTRRVIGVIYAPRRLGLDFAEDATKWLSSMLQEHAGASEVESRVIAAPAPAA